MSAESIEITVQHIIANMDGIVKATKVPNEARRAAMTRLAEHVETCMGQLDDAWAREQDQKGRT